MKLATLTMLALLSAGSHLQATTIAGQNIGGTLTGNNNAQNLGGSGSNRVWAAFGIQMGTTSMEFLEMMARFENRNDDESRTVSGGIYSDSSGSPGSELVSFVSVTLAKDQNETNITLDNSASFTLQANTKY